MSGIEWRQRQYNNTLERSDLHPVLARVYAQRGVQHPDEIDYMLKGLLPPETLLHAIEAGELLAQAISAHRRLVIVGDFDADGATSTALAIRGLRALGAEHLQFRVPDRFRDGYGLTPAIVDEVAKAGADLIITVDNGISSIEGVARARQHGIEVLVTDHHLPGERLPDATLIVNPNQPHCPFASKHLAGVGVMFYVLLATRIAMRRYSEAAAAVNMAQFLDLVALGTVADVVPLDRNNRILIQQGLQRIRAGYACAGINALLMVAKRDRAFLTATDLAFAIGPRINAAGRLDDMSHGILCLLSDSEREAMTLATELDALNQERRHIEADMLDSAEKLLNEAMRKLDDTPEALALFEPDWHQGVIGILAGRIKDRFHRPTFCFAHGDDGVLKGSGRSIPGLHLRDVLANIAAREPSLLLKFGGHAMAAGVSIPTDGLVSFQQAFLREVQRLQQQDLFTRVIWHDGLLQAEECAVSTALALEQAGPWGQRFEEPRFVGVLTVTEIAAKKERYCRFSALLDGKVSVEAVCFDARQFDVLERGVRANAIYALSINRYNGRQQLQLRIEAVELG